MKNIKLKNIKNVLSIYSIELTKIAFSKKNAILMILSLLWLSPNQAQNQTTQTKFSYDASGNVKTIQRGSGRQQMYQYDELDRRVNDIFVSGSKNITVTIGYDGLDQIKSLRDPRNLTTSYELNGLGNRLSQSSPDTKMSRYTHNENGDLLTSQDANGNTTKYSYDTIGRLTSAFYQYGKPSLFEYDGGPTGPPSEIGNLTRMDDESGQTDYSHDLRRRVLTKAQSVVTGSHSRMLNISYSYGTDGASLGKLVMMTYPSGARINYRYDNHGRVESISLNPANGIGATDLMTEVPILADVSYAAFGGVQSWRWGLANSGHSHVRTLDLDGRLLTYPIDLNGAIRTLTYDDVGNILTYRHVGSSEAGRFDQTFTYDLLDRLSSYTQNGIRTDLGYDDNGNRTFQTSPLNSISYAYGLGSNRVLSHSGTSQATFSYDANGNRTSDGQLTFDFNARNRLSNVNGSAQLSFLYNGHGQRVVKIGNRNSIFYAYDEEAHTIGEYSTDGNTLEIAYLGDIPIAAFSQGQVYFVVSDHLNTPLVVTSTNGSVVWDWRNRDPFGNGKPERATAPLPTPQPLDLFDLRFPGQIADSESGLYYNYHRDYDPRTGRYIQSDPIGLGGGINTYGYGLGNPIANVDPQGLFVPLVIPFVCAAGGCEAAGAVLGAGALWWANNNPIANSANGAQSTSTSTSVPECKPDNKDPCEEILKKIRDTRAQLNKRVSQLSTDQYDLYNRAYSVNPGGELAGKGTYIGHQDMIRSVSKGLEKMEAQARAMGCL